MFLSEKAPDWHDGEFCHRCRVQFGLVQRKVLLRIIHVTVVPLELVPIDITHVVLVCVQQFGINKD